MPLRLDLLEHREEIDGLQVRDGHAGNRPKLFEKPLRLLDRRFAPAFLGDHLDIFLGEIAETIRGLELADELVTLPLRERIGALMDFQFGLVALAPGFGEADIRIRAKRNALLLSMHGVFETPQPMLGACRRDGLPQEKGM